MLKNITILTLMSATLFAYSQPSHVELNIYKNAAFMTKIFDIQGKTDISLSLPAQSQLENIKIKSKTCLANNIRLSKPKIVTNKEIKELKNEILHLNTLLQNAIEKNNILSTISLKNKKIDEMEAILNFFDKQFLENSQEISKLKEEITDANKKLKNLQNRQIKNFKEFNASFTCKGTLKITYPQYDFSLNNFYEFWADSSKNRLTIIKKIKILQKSGFDFEHLDIYAHSNSYNQKIAPRPFYPRYLRQTKARMSDKSVAYDAQNQLTKVASYRENFSTSSFVLKNVNLKNSNEKIFTLEKKILNITFSNDIDGYGSTLAYLKTKFQSDKVYQRAISYIYLDSNEVGKRVVPFIKKGDFKSIYFGENQNIKVKKRLEKRFSKNEFFGNTQITTTVWQYKITNISKITQKINLIERLPVSQNEDIKVKPLFDAKNAKMQKNGKVIWSFNLTPNKTKIVKFGYEIKKPKEQK